MKNEPLKIAILRGDGIGKEVVDAALPVLKALELECEYHFAEIGWACWQAEGNPIPQASWDVLRQCDTALLGATTSKPWSEALTALPKAMRNDPPEYVSPIIQLRQKLDLFANVRPCFGVQRGGQEYDFCIIRENTEGLYSGFDFHPVPEDLMAYLKARPEWASLSTQECSVALRVQTQTGLQRIFAYAFAYAKRRGFTRVTLADKPNVLRRSAHFARELFEHAASEYPEIRADILNADAIGLQLVKKPHSFGVIVCENLFGDLLSDVAAGGMGGLGLAPSANMGPHFSYFEPVHGSAPRMKPQTANPCAMFLSIALMLEAFQYEKQARAIKQAVIQTVRAQTCLTRDLGGSATTAEMAQTIINDVKKMR